MPEEVDGALLAAEPAAELLEHARRSSRARARSARPPRRRTRRARGRPGTASSSARRTASRGSRRRGRARRASRAAARRTRRRRGRRRARTTRSRRRSRPRAGGRRSRSGSRTRCRPASGAAAWSARARRRRAARATSGSSAAARPASPCRRSAPRGGASPSSAPTRGRERRERLHQPTTKPISSTKHQLQSSPGSAERTIGCPSSRACRGRVPVRRRVAAPDLPAGLAHAQVEPAVAGLQALLAARDRLGELGHADLVEVAALGH